MVIFRTIIKKFQDWLSKYRAWKVSRQDLFEVRWDESQVTLLKANQFGEAAESKVAWNDIVEIQVYNLDYWAYDAINVGLCATDEGLVLEVSELDLGFHDFITELDRRYPELPNNWYADAVDRSVAEVFVLNLRSLWKAPKLDSN